MANYPQQKQTNDKILRDINRERSLRSRFVITIDLVRLFRTILYAVILFYTAWGTISLLDIFFKNLMSNTSWMSNLDYWDHNLWIMIGEWRGYI